MTAGRTTPEPGIHRYDIEGEGTTMYIIYDDQLRQTTMVVPAELAGPETEEHIRRWVLDVVPAIRPCAPLELVR